MHAALGENPCDQVRQVHSLLNNAVSNFEANTSEKKNNMKTQENGQLLEIGSSAGFGCFVRHGGRDADYEGVVEKITRTGYAARITKGPREHVGKLRHFSRGCWAFLPLPNKADNASG